MSGLPKKGGHGGKFTWSGDRLLSAAEMGLHRPTVTVDVKDSNFEDPDDNVGYDINSDHQHCCLIKLMQLMMMMMRMSCYCLCRGFG
ncbi:hypothetical protein CRG98_003322 [Punica granatum]|nr:hypothetical protein CRG98_003322 [Punica granatum]